MKNLKRTLLGLAALACGALLAGCPDEGAGDAYGEEGATEEPAGGHTVPE